MLSMKYSPEGDSAIDHLLLHPIEVLMYLFPSTLRPFDISIGTPSEVGT